MRNRVSSLGLLLSLLLPTFPAFGALPTAISREVASNAGAFDVPVSGLEALPDLTVTAGPLAKVESLQGQLARDPTPNDPYDQLVPGGNFFVIVVDEGHAARLTATVSSPTASNVDLFVGRDLDGAGFPQVSEVLCASRSASASERCVIDLAPSDNIRRYWVMAQNVAAGPSGVDTIVLSASAPAVGAGSDSSELVVTAPGHVAAGADFALRFAYNEPRMLPGDTWVSLLQLRATRDGTPSAEIPVSLTMAANGGVGDITFGGPNALFGFQQSVALDLAPGAAHDRIAIDVPVDATQLYVEVHGRTDFHGADLVDLYVAKAANVSADTATLPPAPARSAAQGSAIGRDTFKQVAITGGALTPGRWYLTPVNVGSTRAKITLDFSTVRLGAPTLRSGGYFNPSRSGHGVFLSEGNSDRVLIWYAYDDQRQPVWYYAQAPKPVRNDSVWRADLYRFVWNGSRNQGTVAGQVVVTTTGTNRFQFAAMVDGRYTSEPMSELALQECPRVNGVATDFSGSWYAPVLSGYGYSVLTLGRTEVQIAYLYDADGNPRWLYGQASPFGVDTLPLLQLQGFCPTCSYSAPTSDTAGTIQRRYTDVHTGHERLQVDFLAPLSGHWLTDQDTVKLTTDLICP